MPGYTTELEKRLWGAADEFRANSKLKFSEYSVPVLGLIAAPSGKRTIRRKVCSTFQRPHASPTCPNCRKVPTSARHKQQTTRARVFTTIKDILDQLPRAYTKELYEHKCDTLYQHFYEAYLGQGKSLYAAQ